MKTKTIVYIAVTSALSFLLMQLFLPFFGAPFLKIELSEMPGLLLGVFLSPGAGLLAQAVKDLLMLTLGGATIWGVLSDFICGGTLIAGFSIAWHRFAAPPAKRFALAAVIGIALRCIISLPLNYVILGIEFGTTVQSITAMFLPIILPFNALKSLCNIFAAGLVMRVSHKQLQRMLVPERMQRQ